MNDEYTKRALQWMTKIKQKQLPQIKQNFFKGKNVKQMLQKCYKNVKISYFKNYLFDIFQDKSDIYTYTKRNFLLAICKIPQDIVVCFKVYKII